MNEFQELDSSQVLSGILAEIVVHDTRSKLACRAEASVLGTPSPVAPSQPVPNVNPRKEWLWKPNLHGAQICIYAARVPY